MKKKTNPEIQIPQDAALEAAAHRARRLLHKRALVAAAARLLTVPGLD